MSGRRPAFAFLFTCAAGNYFAEKWLIYAEFVDFVPIFIYFKVLYL